MATVKKKELVVAGSLSADQRKYLYTALVFLLPDHPVLHIPAVGNYDVVKVALMAGYERDNIYTSDVSLVAGLVGNLVDPASTPTEFELSEENRARWEKISQNVGSDAITYVAFTMWCMKRASFIEAGERMETTLHHFEDYDEHYVEQIRAKLESQVTELKGIHYRHASVPEILAEERFENEAVVVVPPAYVGKAVKGFKYGEEIDYDPRVEPYTFRREFPKMFEAARNSVAPHIWAQAKGLEGFKDLDILYAKEVRPDKVDYLVTSNREVFEGHKKTLVTFPRREYKPYHLPMWTEDDVLRPDSKIEFVSVSQETVFYYRDLWAHKLGSTNGSGFLLMLIDDKVYSAVIMQMANFMSLMTPYIFEQSGFSAPTRRYPHLHRLLMWCLTCRQFGNDAIRLSSKFNRYYDAVGLETTCLSKYRKLKSNNGIFEVKFRERLPNGMYRIIYQADFREEGYAECIQRCFTDHGLDENGLDENGNFPERP